MTNTEFVSILESLKSDPLSATVRAKRIANVINNSHEGLESIIPLLVSVYSMLSDFPDAIESSSNPDYSYIIRNKEIAQQIFDETIAANTNPEQSGQYIATWFTCSDGVNCYRLGVNQGIIYLNDSLLLRVQGNPTPTTPVAVSFNNIVGSKTLLESINDILTGFGTMNEYATILNTAAETLGAKVQDINEYGAAFVEQVKNSRFLTNADKSSLQTLAASGIDSVIAWFQTKFQNMKKEADDAEAAGDTSFLSTTSIEVSNFSKGILLGGLSLVLNVVSIVVFAISKVAGVIIGILSQIASSVIKMVASATTEYDKTRLKIHWNSNTVDNTMSFCIGQQIITSANIATYMRNHGYTYCTFTEAPCRPLIHYIYLVSDLNSDIIDTNQIGVETHLSLDFDMFDVISTYQCNNNGDSGGNNGIEGLLSTVYGVSQLGIELNRDTFATLNGTIGSILETTCNYGLIKDPETNKFLVLARPETGMVSSNEWSPFPVMWFKGLENYILDYVELAALAYKPVHISKLSSVSYLWNDDLQYVLWRRICTGLFILWYGVFYDTIQSGILSQEWTDLSRAYTPYFTGLKLANTIGSYYWVVSRGGGLQLSIPGYKLTNFFKNLLAPMSKGGSYAGFTKFPSNSLPTISDIASNLDSVILGIAEIYDQVLVSSLPWLVNGSVNDWKIRAFGWHCTTTGSAATSSEFLSTVNLGNIQNGYRANLWRPVYGHSSSIDLRDDQHFIDMWPTNMLVDLPTLTFSGYMAGLIVDGLIAVSAVAIFTVATIGYVKLRNKQAAAQSLAEGKWYAYANNYDNSGTAEAKSANAARWNEYKAARRKCNLLSFVTGGGSLSLGLYDDSTNSNESIVKRITGFVSSSSENDTLAGVNQNIQSSTSGLAKSSELTGVVKTSDLSPIAKTSDLNGLASKTDLDSLASSSQVSELESDLTYIITGHN